MEDLYEEIAESLRDWFKKSKSKDGKPGWVQVVSGKPCARQPGQKTTPKCVSSAKRASMSKKERESAQRRKREADPGQPEKSGAAKPTYVSTDKKKKKKSKKNEDLYMSLEKIVAEELEAVLDEKKKKKKKSGKKDACYHKVKSRYKVWPSAYASGALVKCRKVGAKNWGNSKKESLQIMIEDELSQVLSETHSAKHEKELEKISDELVGASKMHKGQSDRIKKILAQTEDPEKDKVEEENELYEMKNCGCGQDPCKTYGDENKITVKLNKIVEDELQAVLDEKKKKKKPCKPSKGKRFAKRVNGKCRSFGQKGQAKGGGDRIRPGTKKGDAYCARSAKIKKCKNPPCANDLSRKKWKCRGSKSMKE
tara:strand:+ start:463 stop:1563 length:1101 start_codon:yes stop_codon:yes gene_type:complete